MLSPDTAPVTITVIAPNTVINPVVYQNTITPPSGTPAVADVLAMEPENVTTGAAEGSAPGNVATGTVESPVSEAAPSVAAEVPSQSDNASGDGGPASGARDGFASVNPPPAATVGSGSSFVIPVPPTIFRHTRSDAVVRIAVSLPDGSPPPSWLHYNQERGTIEGVAPPEVTAVTLLLTATDERGNSISTTLNLQLAAH